MTPPTSGIEFNDSSEPLFIVEIELFDIRRDLVESDPLIINSVLEVLRLFEVVLKQNKPQSRVGVLRQALSEFPLFPFTAVRTIAAHHL